jgi:hypothetical protein
MKLVLDSKSFIEAISWASKNYDSKDTTAYIAMKVTKNGTGYLFHSNAMSYLKSPFTVNSIAFDSGEDSDSGLTLALAGDYLQALATALKSNPGVITISKDLTNKNSPLDVKTSNGKFKVPILDVRIATEPSIIELGEVDDREYFDSLQRLSKLCDPANAGFMPALGSVDIKLDNENKSVTMMATDRYALGEISLDLHPHSALQEYIENRDGVHLLLPFETATLISPSKGLTSSTTLVHEPKGDKFGYLFSDSRVAVFSLKDAEPIAYLRLKENATSDLSREMTLSTDDFKKALQTVSSLAWEENEIYLSLSEDGLVVHDVHRNNEIAVDAEDVNVDETRSSPFIRSVIMEAFAPISTSKVILSWGDESRTYVLTPLLDDGTKLESTFVFFIELV